MLPKSALATITLATLGIALFCSLGVWQLHRAEQKRALHSQFLAAVDLPAQPLEGFTLEPAPLWRQASVAGTFMDLTVLLDNRVRNGRLGYEVYTVFKPDQGEPLLVNRGWTAAAPSRAEWPRIQTPVGRQILDGRLAPPPSTGIRLGGAMQFEELAQGRWRAQHLDDTGLHAALGVPLRAYTLLMASHDPEGLSREWSLPEPDDGKHTAYAVQWFAFAGIACGLALRALLRKKKLEGTGNP